MAGSFALNVSLACMRFSCCCCEPCKLMGFTGGLGYMRCSSTSALSNGGYQPMLELTPSLASVVVCLMWLKKLVFNYLSKFFDLLTFINFFVILFYYCISTVAVSSKFLKCS